MTPATLPGYLTKKEVEEHFGRSHRSLTRDFSAAVRRKDENILPHLKLHTEDGTVRPGTDVTLEQIQKWSNEGLSPTWFVEGEWAAERYGARTPPASEQFTPKAREHFLREKNSDELQTVPSEVVRHMEEKIRDLQRDKERLHHELDIKNDQIQQANERTRESNLLMNKLQTLLANAQERALLPMPSQPASDSQQHVSHANVIESEKSSEPIQTQTSNVVEKKSRTRSEKGSARPKSKVKPSSGKPTTLITKSAKPKWNEMPTFGRLFRRR